MVQPASRTRFYRNKRRGKVNGLCAGIADYTGIDVTMIRLMLLVSIFMSGGSVIPLYFIAGWITPDLPRELDHDSADEREFWQGVRASPARSARAIGSRLREIDRRLADIEHYVTTENRSLAREIDSLR
jgi:phage shock protein C